MGDVFIIGDKSSEGDLLYRGHVLIDGDSAAGFDVSTTPSGVDSQINVLPKYVSRLRDILNCFEKAVGKHQTAILTNLRLGVMGSVSFFGDVVVELEIAGDYVTAKTVSSAIRNALLTQMDGGAPSMSRFRQNELSETSLDVPIMVPRRFRRN